MEPSASLTEAAASFRSNPWAAALLAQPGVVLFTPTSRLEGEMAVASRTGDQLFRRSLNNDHTIPRCLGFYQEGTGAIADAGKGPPTSLRLSVDSISLLFDLKPGVNGFNGTTHGGLIACLMDEAMGSLLLVNGNVQAALRAQDKPLPPGILNLADIRVVTAGMNVRFQIPVKTPGIVLVTATFVKAENRKIFLDVKITDEQGKENARCDGVWMSLPLRKI